MALTLANTSARDFHLQMSYSGQKNRMPPLPREFICVRTVSNCRCEILILNCIDRSKSYPITSHSLPNNCWSKTSALKSFRTTSIKSLIRK